MMLAVWFVLLPKNQNCLSFKFSNVFNVFDLVHADVWGPIHEKKFSGEKYFHTLIDDFSRETWTYLMKQKSDTSYVIKNFMRMVDVQFGKMLRYWEWTVGENSLTQN